MKNHADNYIKLHGNLAEASLSLNRMITQKIKNSG